MCTSVLTENSTYLFGDGKSQSNFCNNLVRDCVYTNYRLGHESLGLTCGTILSRIVVVGAGDQTQVEHVLKC